LNAHLVFWPAQLASPRSARLALPAAESCSGSPKLATEIIVSVKIEGTSKPTRRKVFCLAWQSKQWQKIQTNVIKASLCRCLSAKALHTGQ